MPIPIIRFSNEKKKAKLRTICISSTVFKVWSVDPLVAPVTFSGGI